MEAQAFWATVGAEKVVGRTLPLMSPEASTSFTASLRSAYTHRRTSTTQYAAAGFRISESTLHRGPI